MRAVTLCDRRHSLSHNPSLAVSSGKATMTGRDGTQPEVLCEPGLVVTYDGTAARSLGQRPVAILPDERGALRRIEHRG